MNTPKPVVSIACSTMFVAGLFFGYIWAQQGVPTANLPLVEVPKQSSSQFQLMIDYGDDQMKSINDIAFTPGQTLLDVMQASFKKEHIDVGLKEYAGLGTLVTKIGGKENGKDKRYWQYWVNGKHPDIGADAYVLQPGDVVEWKFTSAMGS